MRRDEAAGDVVETTPTGESPVGVVSASPHTPAPPTASSTAVPGAPLLVPVRPDERIASLDVLRGIAVLGILLTNIYSFGLPGAASRHPAAYGGADGANLVIWLANHVVVEGKLRAIFCMLFGASVILLIGRAERRGAGVEVADVYYRRTLWLILFGMVHGYFIWAGDILFHFGVIGLTLFPLRKLSARTLCVLGTCALLLHSVQVLRSAYSFNRSLQTVSRYDALVRSGQPLSAEQEQQLRDARESFDHYRPDPQSVEAEIRAARAGYLANLKARLRFTASMHSSVFYRSLLLDIGGAVLLGMGLMKFGVLDGSRSFRFYAWMAAVGYGFGLPLNIALDAMWVRSNLDLSSMYAYIRVPYDVERISIAAGHIALVMMICKTGLLPRFREAMSRVGRMALSNYVLTSVLCSLFFSGYGLGMFARLERYQLLYVVAAVWALLVAFSGMWLGRFRFGPLEWLWRSLTYWKWQPMRGRAGAVVG